MYGSGRNGGRRGGKGGDGGGRGGGGRGGHGGRGGEGRGSGGHGGRGGRGGPREAPLDTAVSLSRVLGYQSRGRDVSPADFVRAITEQTNVDELVLRLEAKENETRIEEILKSPCQTSGRQTFQTVVLPFVEFLVSPQFKQSLHATTKKALYRRVAGEELFLTRLVNCFKKERDVLEASSLLGRGVSACVELLYQVCTKLPTLLSDDPFIYNKAHDLHSWILSNDVTGVTPQIVQLLDETLDLCEELLPADAARPRHGADAQAAAELDQYRIVPQETRRVRQILPEDDRGPRHDNDHAHFARVQVLPTHAEISCLEEPRLPYYPDSSSPLTRVVDFHFRLVREDMLAQLRRSIQWFLGGPGLGQFRQHGAVEPPRHENIPKLLVCSDVELAQVGCHSRKGVFFSIRASQPRMRSTGGQSKNPVAVRREFWEGTDRLSVGSLVALAFGVSKKTQKTPVTPPPQANAYPRSIQLRAAHVFFGQVASRDDRDLHGNEKKITTHLKFSEADADRVLRCLRRQQHDEDSFLIEATGVCFPPTQAILRTLQTYEVVQPPPLLEQIFGAGTNEVFTRAPSADGERHPSAWNLQHLVRDDCKAIVNLRQVSAASFEDLCAQLHPLERHNRLKLDGSQVEAFAAAMTRACCLIQGPPGTGKSYVGVKIVETLLAQPRAAVPILCVCYTNHALDQFLEDLVNSKACALHDIVRIGGSSKSELLQGRNMMQLEMTETHDERFTYSRLYKQCKDHEEKVFTAFNDKKDTSGSLLKWLQTYHGQEYRAIVNIDGEDDDGFETKDSRGTKPVDRWKSWLAGKTAPALVTEAAPAAHANARNLTGVLAECGGDIWKLSKKRRKAVANAWTDQWLDHSDGVLAREMEKYEDFVAQMRELNLARRLRVLRSCKIVGMTTTGCAQNQELVRALAPKIVVCEEAGEVLEAHLLSCITPGIEQLIQIGDHQQLRPPVTEYKLSESAGRGHNLDISLFERLVNDSLRFYGGNVDLMRRRGVLVTLQTQRRMRPAIADLVRFTLYRSLQDAPVVQAYPNVKGFRDNLWFFDHDQAETSDESSKSNKFEAEMAVELVSYAIKQGYAGQDIAVLTPYLGQLRVIRRLLSAKSMRIELDERDAEELAKFEDDDNDQEEKQEEQKPDAIVGSVSMQQVVRLSTVDNFQGDEATLVFISTVRCNKDGKSGFLKIDNRMNVMLSRARHGMVILGSSRTVRQENRAKMFLKVLDLLEVRNSIGEGEIILTCQRHGHHTRVTSPSDVRNLTPDGGCLEPCQARLPCGHACPKMCHVDDPGHRLVRCLEPCDKQIDTCGHFCRRLCSDECVCSHVFDEKTLGCGHVVKKVACPQWRVVEQRPCTRLVKVTMPVCGHEVSLPCPTARKIQEAGGAADRLDLSLAYLCNHACGGKRDGCGHACTRRCGECLEATRAPSAVMLKRLVAQSKQLHPGDCGHVCDRAMTCGHYCQAACHPAGECPPCDQVCENKCSHSTCSKKCSDVCASCSESCGWHCPHTETSCPLPCGSPCIRLPCNERCYKMLPDCGHQCPGLCGETCLPSSYCRECGPSVAHAEDVVDLIMHETLSGHDPTESPLVLLGCGHALTVETLDGVMGITEFYNSMVSTEGEVLFTAAKPLDPEAAQGDWTAKYKCPHCRFLIVGGINRYGRVLKYAQTRNGELKFLQEVMTSVKVSRQLCATQSVGLNAVQSDKAALKKLETTVRKQYTQWKKFVRTKTPTQELMVKEMSRLDRLQLQAETLNLAAYRQVIMKQSLIHMRLEYLNVFTLWLQTVAASDEVQSRVVGKAQVWQQTFQEAAKLERELLTLCDESQSRRSKWDARVAGVRMRCCFVLASRGQMVASDLAETVKRQVKTQYDAMKGGLATSDRVEQDVAALKPLVEQVFRPAVFYQQMTAEEKRSVQLAMGYDSNHMGQFGGLGGHWYACPNGHPYVITECGGAMEVGKCSECQAPIGGGGHRLLNTNTSAQAYFGA